MTIKYSEDSSAFVIFSARSDDVGNSSRSLKTLLILFFPDDFTILFGILNVSSNR